MSVLRAVVLAAAFLSAPASALAQTRLTDFHGEWQGSGQDRDAPLQALQDTTCRNGVRATADRIRIDMACERKSGGQKTIRINADLQGDALSGRINQRTPQADGKDKVMAGTLAGKKTNGSASFVVDWKGMTPDTTVTLKLLDPGTFSMQATAMGMTFMDVTFKRTSNRPPPRQRRERAPR